MRSWRTTLFGIIIGLVGVANQYGIKIGHVGNGDWLGLIGLGAAVGLGYNAKDKQTTGQQL